MNQLLRRNEAVLSAIMSAYDEGDLWSQSSLWYRSGMGKKDLSGKRLERLVAMLEGVFAGTNATIESPSRRLVDRDTGKPREHDVLITWDHGHHRIITAIECRDRSRPVGVPDVEAFADKCARTGVHSGVIVSATSFRNSARVKAAARSITCMDLAEVERFDWLAMEAFVGYERKFGHVEARIMFNDAQPDALSAVFDADGTQLSEQQILTVITHSVPAAENPEDEVGKLFPVNMHMLTPGWTAHDTEGNVWPIDHIEVQTSFTMEKTVSTVQTHRYVGGGKDYAIASADAKIGEVVGKFMMVRNEDDTTSVYWTPDKHGKQIGT